MADEANIFANNTTTTQQSEQNTATGNSGTTQEDQSLTHLLNTIKNERGEPKYKTTVDALVGLKNAQEHIPQLNQKLSEKDAELERLRAQLAEKAQLEETVRQLTEQQKTPPSTQDKSFGEQEIAEILNRQLSEREKTQSRQANIAKVVQTIKGHFGDKAEDVFYQKASELGFSKEQINTLAADNPTAVFKLVGIDAKPQGFRTPTSDFNTTGFTPRQESFAKRNDKSVLFGATTQEVNEEARRSRQLVDEIHAQGYEIHDLTDPKVYNKVFNR